MKSKLLTLLTLTMLTGSLLVGCGGTETGADNGGNTNTETTVQAEVDSMSEKAKAFFDKIRAGVIEDNKTIEEYGKGLPKTTMRYLEEANSPDGMDCVTVLYSKPDSEEDYAIAIDVIRQLVYNQGYSKYYLEYIGESDGMVEFNIYGGNETEADNGGANTEVDTNFSTASNDATTETMSEESIRVFNAIREGIKETSDARKANVSDYAGIVEADSPEGMEECLGPVGFFFDKDNIDDIVHLVTMYNNGWCTSYYIEFVNETDTYVEFNLHVK